MKKRTRKVLKQNKTRSRKQTSGLHAVAVLLVISYICIVFWCPS
uniref:Uncharacterized protein n=1 Tax=Rhizophora mucronata TaxID=61149 RepID=A0A2P2IR62_RHIMU